MKCLNLSIKISGRFEMQPKWNFIWTELVFTPVWNLKPVWVHFAPHVTYSQWQVSLEEKMWERRHSALCQFMKQKPHYRSSLPEVFCVNGALKNFPKSPVWDSFLNKVQASDMQLYQNRDSDDTGVFLWIFWNI